MFGNLNLICNGLTIQLPNKQCVSAHPSKKEHAEHSSSKVSIQVFSLTGVKTCARLKGAWLSEFLYSPTKNLSPKKLFFHVAWLSCRNPFSLPQKKPLVKFYNIPVVFFGFSFPRIECFTCFFKLFQISR